jgi:hypothetical protein
MKSKQIPKCPEELNTLLGLINSLPNDVALDTLNKEVDQIYESLRSDFNQIEKGNFSDNLPKLQRKYLDKLEEITPPNLVPTVFIGGEADFYEALQNLSKLIYEKQTLRQIICDFKTFIVQNGKKAFIPTFKFEKPIKLFSFNDDLTLNLASLRCLELLKQHHIPMNRLKECPICKRIFWAKRADGKRKESSTCENKKCSNLFHQRNLRIKQYEERQKKQMEKLKEYKLSLNPSHNVITKLNSSVYKLSWKIIEEKAKNDLV